MTERFSDDEEMLRILVEQQQKDYELNKDLLLERMSDEDLAALQKSTELDEETRLALAQGLGDEADYQNVVPLKTREERDNPLRPFVKTGLEVLSLPKPKALVGDWLDVETVNAWYGKPKGGKTFAALDLGMCVASGTHWHGSPVEQRPVLYVAAEGVRYFPDRIKAWCAVNNVQQSALDNTHFVIKAVNLMDQAQVLDLCDQIKELDVGLVILDTLARCMAGGDENSSKDMGQAIDGLDQLKRANETTVLVVHHSGKDRAKGLRGSSALLGAVDSSVFVDGQNGTINLLAEDQRGRPEGDVKRLKLKQAGDGAALVGMDRQTAFEEADMQNASKALKALERIATDEGVTRGNWNAICQEEYGWSDSTFNRAVKDVYSFKMAHQLRDRGPWYPGKKPLDDE